MSYKTIFYLSLLILALLVLAAGSWLAKGVKAIADQTRQSPLQPRVVG
jgi:hypothetical protein